MNYYGLMGLDLISVLLSLNPGWVSILILWPWIWPSLGVLFLSQEANEEGQAGQAGAGVMKHD